MVKKTYELLDVPAPDPSWLDVDTPPVSAVSVSYAPETRTLALEISGDEPNVDEAARLLLAHFTPEEDSFLASASNTLTSTWGRIVNWWNS